jgi:hypothetical protein
MAYADLVFVERLDHCRSEFRQFHSLGAISGSFPRLRGDLFDAVFRLLQVQQGAESLRLFQRVYVPAL